MTIDEYRKEVESIPFGKRVAAALYVYRDGATTFGPKIDTLPGQLIISFNVLHMVLGPGESTRLIK